MDPLAERFLAVPERGLIVEGFLRAILNDPSSAPATWLVLADWLEDRSDPRAELVRLQHDDAYRPDLKGKPRDECIRDLLRTGVKPCVPTRKGPAELVMALIPSGKFLMGPPAGDHVREPQEEPQHEVEITQPFYLGIHPVTVKQYQQFIHATHHRSEVGVNGNFAYVWRDENWLPDRDASWRAPGFDQHFDCPVTCVTWNDARAFCWWLHTCDPTCLYRLPTEAEWEYACRAGANHPVRFHYGDALGADLANFDGEAPCGGSPIGPFLRQTTRVGFYPPNAFGLYDMHGNVFEMCHDRYDPQFYSRMPATDPAGPMDGFEWLIWYDQNTLGREQVAPSTQEDSLRVTRGGSWLSDGMYCRSAHRSSVSPTRASSTLGFRVVAIPRPAFSLS